MERVQSNMIKLFFHLFLINLAFYYILISLNRIKEVIFAYFILCMHVIVMKIPHAPGRQVTSLLCQTKLEPSEKKFNQFSGEVFGLNFQFPYIQ